MLNNIGHATGMVCCVDSVGVIDVPIEDNGDSAPFWMFGIVALL